jgi:gluconokinase
VATASTDIVVVMGVSGCGKSRVGELLARRLGSTFLEGDAFHPPENVARMRAGTPLTDEDRAGWLQRLSGMLAQHRAAGRGAVLACSALKRRYRDVLRAGAPELRLAFLHGPRGLLASRLAARQHAYMPATLLDSQLATLEPPADDERAIACDIGGSPEVIVEQIVRSLRAVEAGPYPARPPPGIGAPDRGESH